MSTIRQKPMYRLVFSRWHTTGIRVDTTVYCYTDLLPRVGDIYSFGMVTVVEPVVGRIPEAMYA